MPKQATITEEQKEQVVRLYREGKKWADIAREVGILQPNIGWILNEKGERRNRRKPPSEELTVAQVLERALMAERDAAEWRVRYEQERLLNERLMDELARLRAQVLGNPDVADPRRIWPVDGDNESVTEP